MGWSETAGSYLGAGLKFVGSEAWDFGAGVYQGVTTGEVVENDPYLEQAEALNAEVEAALAAAGVGSEGMGGVTLSPTSGGSKPYYNQDIRPLLQRALGKRYWYGAGGIWCPWPEGGPGGGANAPYGWDCSGFALRVLFLLGLIWPKSKVGRRAVDLSTFCQRVEVGQQGPGDLAFYDPGDGVCHVVVVVCPPNSDGHSICFGASGDGASTLGQDPEQCVKEHRSDYWSAFSHFGRVPADKTAQGIGRLLMLGSAGKSISTLVPGLSASQIAEADSAIRKIYSYLYPSGV